MRLIVLLLFLGACTGGTTGTGTMYQPAGGGPGGDHGDEPAAGHPGDDGPGGADSEQSAGGAGASGSVTSSGGSDGAAAAGGTAASGAGGAATGGAGGAATGGAGGAATGGLGGAATGGLGGAATGGAGGAAMPGTGGAAPANLRPAIIGAGYGGIRLVSFDDGRTWTNRKVEDPNGGDDDNLIRAIGYVNGVWIGAGWKIFRSEDGLNWTQMSSAQVPGGWYDCVTYDQARGWWIVKVIRSDYGGQNGEAIISTDRGLTWRSTRETTRCSYEPMPFPTGTAQLKSEWRGEIWRMPSGGSWTRVLQDCCSVVRFARGMAVDPRAQ